MLDRLRQDSPGWIEHIDGWTKVDRWYMLPYLRAYQAGHPRLGNIGVLNLLFGWTIVGWVGALIWASMKPQAKPAYPVVMHRTTQ